MSLTRQLRDELAHLPARPHVARMAEASAMVRFGGSLHLRGGGERPAVSVVVRCASGAVARRLRATLVEALDVHPGLAQARGGNLAGSTAYLVEIDAALPGAATLRPLGVLDEVGRPAEGIAAWAVAQWAAYAAGAMMVAGRLSGSGQAVHLEVTAPGERAAADLGAMLDAGVSGTRVVLKSGERVAELLAEIGAHATFLDFEEGRMRRVLRGDVTRSVNADQANLRRTADAAAAQIAAIESLVRAIGWDGLPEALRDTALARVANPEASLADLGRLLDPPVAKATVHRRLQRLEVLADP